MLVTDGQGLPLGVLLESANKAEVSLVQATLETVKVRTPKGRMCTWLNYLTADKGYDSRKFRKYLRGRRMGHCISPIRHQGRFRRHRLPTYDATRYALRWIIKRSNAWLQNYRRILVRYDHLLSTYRGFVLLACRIISLGALLK